MTQIEAETWLRAAALLGLGLVLWLAQWAGTVRRLP
jgi:hypothetical protein